MHRSTHNLRGFDQLEPRLVLAGDILIDTQPPTVSITSSNPVMRLGAPATLTFTLSEDATGFDASDLGVSAGLGTLSNFEGSGRTYTATLTPTMAFNDRRQVAVWVEAGRLTDLAGNVNDKQSASFTIDNFPADTTPPTVTITGDRTILNRGGSTRITFKLSEPAADFTDGDVTVTPDMGTLSSLARLKSDASGLTYTAWFTAAQNVSGIGTAVISVASNSFTDAAGNGNLAASLSLTIDAVLPTLTITTSTPSLRRGQTATITFTLSEYSNTFSDSAVTVTNGTLSNFRGSGQTYSATFTPKNGFTGTGTVSVAAGAFRDPSGNANATGASVGIAIDTWPPSVCISSDRTVLVPGSMIDRTVLKPGDSTRITFRLSEPSADFTATDVSVTPNMGTLTSFAQLQSDASGLTYTALFTAAQNLSGNSTACISVASNAFTDAAGNGNLSASLSLTIDAVPPTVTITGDRTILNRGGETRITFRLSEPAADFTDGDVTVTPGMGTLSSLTRLKSDASGLTYTAWFTAAQNVSGIGTAVISVASNSFTDAAGNGNLAASLSLTIDAVLPTLTITTSTPSLRRGQTATITFTFSEDVVGFTPSAVTFVNGTLTNFRGSGRIYTATFTPRANFVGFGSAFVRAGAFTDLAGNANLEARLQVQLPTAP